ncbi:MAG: indoleacetamide hydrolase [Solirubrobacteraceae bacterium]
MTNRLDRDPADLTACEAVAALRAGSLDRAALGERVLGRARRHGALNGWITLDEETLARVDQVDGPLCGLPIACKDNIESAALPTTAGTPALEQWRPNRDAPALSRLLAAGGVLAGKTNLHELGFGVTSNNARFGPVRNPYNLDRVAGGSSGGTAALVAARVVPAGLGTDTGGSVRIPAALCGVVGFRPTHGRYPGAGVVPISPTRDTVGVIARTASDVALLDRLLDRDPPRISAPASLSIRIGVPRAFFYENLDPDVAAVSQQALDALSALGVELVEEDLPRVEALDAAAGFPIALYEGRRALERYLEAVPGVNLITLAQRAASPDVRTILTSLLDRPLESAVYRQALGARDELRAAYHAYFQQHQVAAIALPTVPLPAPPIGDDITTPLNGREVPVFPTLSRNTNPGSLAGIPGLSLPLALPSDHPPVGLELDAPRGADEALLALGVALQARLPRLPAPDAILRA